MALFTARGQQVKENINRQKVDLSKVQIRLKQNESVKVRVLGLNDYVEYLAHSSFQHKIYTQPCVGVTGANCPLCTASKSGIEGFDALVPRKRYIFAFGDMESGEIKILDVSKNQAKKLIADMEEYADDINDIAFNLKKVGEGTSTGYSLNPILKMKGNDQDQFDAFEDVEVTDEYFGSVLVPRKEELQVKILHESGFPVEEFGMELPEDAEGKGTTEDTEKLF